ncbi:MAG: OmpH family outer membrane protein [Elusimicrobia bacterium]|nr:OmpH family outer membrane protein [Elusimicrobiota bacterium]
MRHFLFGSFLIFFCGAAWGLEIPVRRGGPAGSSVGYVDMELVFREYPEARKAREDYRAEVVRHKGELAERERALEDLKGELAVLKGASPPAPTIDRSSIPTDGVASVPSTSTVLTPALSRGASPVLSDGLPQRSALSTQTPDASTSTGTAASVAEGISFREGQLLKRQKELEEARASSAQALKAFEASRAKTILGRLYKALVELANERGISIVVDKSAILYGQNTIDLTEALNRRVRGLPEEEK